MIAARDVTPYCAAVDCDLNLAGWPHLPWDCDAPLLLAPTLAAASVARLPAWRRPWVQGSARTFARLNPVLAGGVPEPREELPGELACEPRQRQRLREQEATATLGERAGAGLRAENAPPDSARRVVITDRATFARLHALDRDLLLDAVTRRPAGTPDLSQRSVLDTQFHVFLLSDHPAAVAERCRRRAVYLDDTARERELLLGWLGKLDAIPPRPGDPFDDSVRRMAEITRRLLDRQAARLTQEVGEPDPVRVARQRQQYDRYPTRWVGPAAARQPIPPERPSRTTRAGTARRHRDQRRGGDGHER